MLSIPAALDFMFSNVEIFMEFLSKLFFCRKILNKIFIIAILENRRKMCIDFERIRETIENISMFIRLNFHGL